MVVKEVCAKTILSKSKVLDYTVNPYVGCMHGCTYCYVRFIKEVRWTYRAVGQVCRRKDKRSRPANMRD